MSSLQDPKLSTSAPNAKVDPQSVTISGYEVDQCYGPHSVQTTDARESQQPHQRIGSPGEFPYTRGIHKTMYRGRLWTMRQARIAEAVQALLTEHGAL